MVNLFITTGKYICILLVLLYTYSNFRCIRLRGGEEHEALLGWQYRIILLMQFLCHFIIFFRTENRASLVLYGLQVIFFSAYPFLMKKAYPKADGLLLNNICFFLSIGMIMLERLDYSKAVRQFAIILISMVPGMLLPFLMSRLGDLSRWRLFFCIVGILMLFSVFLLGAVSYGARMSLSFFGFSFHASEFVKISFVFCMAGMLPRARTFKDILLCSLAAAAHILILVMCRDLGSALIFFLSFVAMLYVATGQLFYLAAAGGMLFFAGILSYRLFSHVRTRVFAWIDPWADIDNKGYQITQSLFAIGTGGFLGLGLFRGLPNKIPIVEKDFIFSAISEEMGGITAICLCLVCLGCFMKMMQAASFSDKRFEKIVAVGLAVQYILQVFLTIGGAVKFIPSTGVTLPFVSYGGSSITASFLVFSIIQALFIKNPETGWAEDNEEDWEIWDEEEHPFGKRRRRMDGYWDEDDIDDLIENWEESGDVFWKNRVRKSYGKKSYGRNHFRRQRGEWDEYYEDRPDDRNDYNTRRGRVPWDDDGPRGRWR